MRTPSIFFALSKLPLHIISNHNLKEKVPLWHIYFLMFDGIFIDDWTYIFVTVYDLMFFSKLKQ